MQKTRQILPLCLTLDGVVDKLSGCSRGFGYEKQAMDDAIEEMNGLGREKYH